MDAKSFCLFNEHSAITSLRTADGAELLAAKINETKSLAERKAAKRSELLTLLRAGEHVELELEADVFFQADGIQNRNFVRFKDSILKRFAKSFVGSPFLRDHKQGDMLSVGGTILESGIRDAGAGKLEGGKFIEQTIRLSAPWVVELALTGILDKFSIGWNPTGAINCTACKASFRDCGHWPGDELDDGTVVEAEFQSAEGIETSAVPIPAVPQVGISEVRAALALARKQPQGDHSMDIATLAKALGVPEGTELADFVNGLRTERDDLQVQLAAEQAAHAQTRTALDVSATQLATVESTALAVAVDLLIDKRYDEGRLAPKLVNGQRVESDPEKQLRAYAKQFGAEAAAKFSEPWPVITAAGKGSIAAQTAPPKATNNATASTVFGPVISSALAQLGQSQEDALMHNPHIRDKQLA